MKAVIFHAVGDIRLDTVAEPVLGAPTDAIVRLTASAICGTDLHLVRGTVPGMRPGTILGHEGVGIVEATGSAVRNFRPGDRVVIASTISCGYCSYCRAAYSSQCDNANPNGPRAGTAFFGGPLQSGPFQGLQAELACIPYAHVGLIRLPPEIDDDQAILLSDILPTGYFAAALAEIRPGDTVAVFGAGPVGQFAISSAQLCGAGRVIVVDHVESRLAMAQRQGAETVDFDREDPVEVIRQLTGGIGVDRAIDAVGVDALRPHAGPAALQGKRDRRQHDSELAEIAPDVHPTGDLWRPGDAPTQALHWAVDALAKAGTLAVVGVYPESDRFFPVGMAMNKNLTVRMGHCNHRAIIPKVLALVRSGVLDPARVLTQVEPLMSAIQAYECFDLRAAGWVKVMLDTTTPSVVKA